MVFVPPYAAMAVLAFLAAGFLTVAGSAVALFGALSKRRGITIAGIAVASAVAVAYLIFWGAVGLCIPERILSTGGRKYFCEIDCHLAYSVQRVERLESLGTGAPASTNGEFRVVTLETWFDPGTISPRRPPDAPLRPNPRTILAEDAAGRRYAPRSECTTALIRAGRASTPVTEPLRPGDSYRTLLVFDVPRGARNLRLYVGAIVSEGGFLVGHEASPLAKKTWFAID